MNNNKYPFSSSVLDPVFLFCYLVSVLLNFSRFSFFLNYNVKILLFFFCHYFCHSVGLSIAVVIVVVVVVVVVVIVVVAAVVVDIIVIVVVIV